MIFILFSILSWIVGLYADVLLIRVIIDWVLFLVPRFRPGPILGSIINVFYVLTDPPLRWLRRYVPPIRLGSLGLDITPILLWFIIYIIIMAIRFII